MPDMGSTGSERLPDTTGRMRSRRLATPSHPLITRDCEAARRGHQGRLQRPDLPLEATWRSGDAADCKSAYPGSIPGVASNLRAGGASVGKQPRIAKVARRSFSEGGRSALLCNGSRLLLSGLRYQRLQCSPVAQW